MKHRILTPCYCLSTLFGLGELCCDLDIAFHGVLTALLIEIADFLFMYIIPFLIIPVV